MRLGDHSPAMPVGNAATALAIRHVPFEDLGSFAPVLARHGYEAAYLEAGVDDLAGFDPLKADLLVVLGGPIGANDEADFPFLRDEIRLLARRLAGDRPTLGVCLGAQLIAKAAGGRVYPAKGKEIGWGALSFTAAGRRSCLAPFAESDAPVLHWHGDTFDLPAGAVRLASTPLCVNQAFSLGSRVLGLQFHVEATAQGLERWLIGHAVEIHVTPGVDVATLRADSRRYAEAAAAKGAEALAAWLARLG